MAFAEATHAPELALVIGPLGAVLAWTSLMNSASPLHAFDRFACAA